MGTETETLQNEINGLISRLGWSQKRLAREIHALEFEDTTDTPEEIMQAEERLKKHLSRKTTAPERLRRYLELLQEHDDFRRLQVVVPRYIPARDFSEAFVEGMKSISQALDVDAMQDESRNE